MREAHALARRFQREDGGRYREHLAYALRFCWSDAKRAAASAEVKEARARLTVLSMSDYLTPADRAEVARLERIAA